MNRLSVSILSLSALFFAACNNEAGSDTPKDDSQSVMAVDTTGANPNASPDLSKLPGCYTVIHGKDTSTLQLSVNGTSVSGPLTYSLYEKDRNDGTMQAEVKDDLLVGWYLFKSEGIMSIRQVIWKIRDNQLWPGMGEMRSNKDTLLFNNPDKLQYDSTHPFEKKPCVL